MIILVDGVFIICDQLQLLIYLKSVIILRTQEFKNMEEHYSKILGINPMKYLIESHHQNHLVPDVVPHA